MFQVIIQSKEGHEVFRSAYESASVLIGRAEGCDIHLEHASISRKHVRVWDDGQDCFYEDLNSTSGVIDAGVDAVGIRQVDGRAELNAGEFLFRIIAASEFEAAYPYLLRSLGPPVAENVFPLAVGRNLLGREASCEVTLSSEEVSRKHASITIGDGSVQVADLESVNGVLVNGEQYERVELKHGDVLLLGDTELLFSMTKTELDRLYPDGKVPADVRWSQDSAMLASQRRTKQGGELSRFIWIVFSSLAFILALVAFVYVATQPSDDESDLDSDMSASSSSGTSSQALADYMDARTVWIMAKAAKGWSTGTGFFIGPKLVLTNRHVVDGVTDATVMSRIIAKEARLGFAQAKVIHVSKGRWPCTGYCRDYAILELKDYESQHLVTFTPRVAKLDEVVAVGFPGAVVEYHKSSQDQPTPPSVITRGVVNAILNPDNKGGPVIINHDARVMHGNSGGPLVDRCKRVIGINTFVAGPGFKADFALGTVDILRFLDENGIKAAVDQSPCKSE